MQGNAPAINVTSVVDFPLDCSTPGTCTGRGVEDIRTIEGTDRGPLLPEPDAAARRARAFNLGSDGLPQRIPGNVYDGAVQLQHPALGRPGRRRRQPDVAAPARASMYGHGLFGDYDEVYSANVRQLGNENNVITCATDWIGMAEEDVFPVAIPALQDLSKFAPLPDRLQQGFLNFLYLGRR